MFCMAAAIATVPGRRRRRKRSYCPPSTSRYTYSLWWVVMLMYAGLNSLNFSIVENRRSVPVPFSGGSTSNEKCLLPSALLSISLMFIFR